MRWKTTVLLLVLTVGVGAYVSLYELKQPTPEERERRSRQVISIAPASVSRLEIALPQAGVSVVRDGTTWRMSPAQVRADPERIERILRDVNPLMAERVLSGTPEAPLDPSAFGLSPPVGRISLHADGAPTSLLLGETTAVHGNRYLQVEGRPEVFVVPPALFEDANQPTETFRDPRLVRLDPWAVDQLALAAPEVTLSLTRTDNRWTLTQPLEDRADRAEVTALLRTLADIQIRRFVEDQPQSEGLASWGLEHPALEVTVARGTPAVATTLVFGGALPDDPSLVYAKRSDEPPLYAVAAADLEPLRRDPHGLRERACFELFADLASRIEVTREGATWALERTDGRWQEAGSGEELASERVEAWLNQVAELRASGFEDDAPSDLVRYGLAPPSGAITVRTTDREEPQRLLIGSTVDGSGSRYGRIEGRAAVVRLPESVVELLAPLADETAGPKRALQDGEVGQEGEQGQRPPEEVMP
ncbi:MAG: DUF4340 domain-containing protein [Candidatus Omnitrophica bacterium]|nr:DUF4340 domain-containing protein [Candidatus Omnitrophota bacterium]